MSSFIKQIRKPLIPKSNILSKYTKYSISYQGRPTRGPEWKRPGSVFQPITWKPRWMWQATLLAICVSLPILQTFLHSYVPGLDYFTEVLVCSIQ